jgi:hypothetical protein
MQTGKLVIFTLLYVWTLNSINAQQFKRTSFDRRHWFDEGNIFHINYPQYWTKFQQDRNASRQ